jgi:hypothetical protein
MPTKFDPVTWAKGAPAVKKVNKCYTCKHSEVAKALELILKTIIDGEAQKISVMQIWATMKQAYGYKYSYTTFKGHVTTCTHELWLKAYKE